MNVKDLDRWLAVGSQGGLVRLLPVPPPSSGPDVFCKLMDAQDAIHTSVTRERDRCVHVCLNTPALGAAYEDRRNLVAVIKNSQAAPTALSVFERDADVSLVDPLERLRFFCSNAMNSQDWLDSEPFFEAVQALINKDKP